MMREKFEVVEGDVGFFRIGSGPVAKTIEPCDNILIDLDASGAPLTIEVVGLSHFTDQQIIEAVAPLFIQNRLLFSAPGSSGFAGARILAPEGMAFRREVSKESATCGA